MSYINNMNPRRMIWFNQNAPKNKMDLWLSYNRHYEDTSENETVDPQQVDDNPSQRKCDLILKAWDCGKWIPIVGFNTTAANKIDTVTGVDYTIDGVTHSGKNVYHPAIFTAESPNELYDAGTLGELLKDTHFVTEGDWDDIYNEYIKTIIEQYPFDLWPAEPNKLGGIWANTYSSGNTSFAQCRYKSNADKNLYISGESIIAAINGVTGDTVHLDIELANTECIGGIKAAQDPNTADDCRNIPIVLAGPNVGSVWGLPFGSGTYPGDTDNETEYLYLPGWALMEWLENPYLNGSGDTNPIISGWRGTRVRGRQDESGLWIELDGIALANDGQIPKRKTVSGEVSIEWVDLPEGSQDTWRPISAMISQHEQPIPSGNALYIAEGTGVNININTVGSGTTLTISASGTDYTGTNLIDVSGSVIGIDMSQNPSNGDVIICDSGVAKWGAVPNPKFSGLSINANNGNATLNGLVLSSNASLQIEGEQSTRSDYSLNTWNYYNISNFKSFSIEDVPDEMEPIYIRLIQSSPAVSCTGDTIDIGDVLSSPSGKDIFITMQFNIAKFEEINVQSTPVINDQN